MTLRPPLLASVLLFIATLAGVTGCQPGSENDDTLLPPQASEGGINGTGVDNGGMTGTGILLAGYSNKGPFTEGSLVRAFQLDENGNPATLLGEALIQNSLGYFELPVEIQGTTRILLVTEGYYFNELTGELSSDRVTLSRIVNVSPEFNQTVNLSAFSTALTGRLQQLFRAGISFPEAARQSRAEFAQWLSGFMETVPDTDLAQLRLEIQAGENPVGSNALLYISALLLEVAETRASLNGTAVDTELNQLTEQLTQDFADNGIINDSELNRQLICAAFNVNPVRLQLNLYQYHGWELPASSSRWQQLIDLFFWLTSHTSSQLCSNFPVLSAR